jgi:hypothetical protein
MKPMTKLKIALIPRKDNWLFNVYISAGWQTLKRLKIHGA